MKVAITFMNGPRIPYDVIKQITISCKSWDEGMRLAKEHVAAFPIPDDTTQIHIDIWED